MNPFVKDYLNSIGLSKVSELTDKQVEEYFTKHLHVSYSVMEAFEKVKEGVFTREEVYKSMRKAMNTGKMFICCYVMDESYNGEHNSGQTGWILKP